METESKTEYPFLYQELSCVEMEEISNYFTYPFSKLIRLGSSGYVFYDGFDTTAKRVYNMKIRPNDTFVLSFPRSGTTWTQELVWLLQNDCDFEKAQAIALPKRLLRNNIKSGIFTTMKYPEELLESNNFNKFIEEMVMNDPELLSTLLSPRFIKSHIPISIMPACLIDTAKVVYVARDPRDVAVSFFYHMKSWNYIPHDREFKSFWNYFVQNKILWCPYFEHVKEAWRHRNHPNLFFLFYEELSKDLTAVARRLATFFGKKYSEKQFQELSNHLEFNNFKNNKSVNREKWHKTGYFSGPFIRKGKSGGWREHFDAEMSLQAEHWIADNLRDTDLQYPTDN